MKKLFRVTCEIIRNIFLALRVLQIDNKEINIRLCEFKIHRKIHVVNFRNIRINL